MFRISFVKSLEISLVIISILMIGMMQALWLSIESVINIHFYLYILLIVLNFSRLKRFNLLQVWILGYIFIILSEMLIMTIDQNSILDSYLNVITYLILSNDVLLLGYYCYSVSNNNRIIYKTENYSSKLFFIVILFLYVSYLYTTIPKVINNLLYGRQLANVLGSGSLWGSFIGGVELALPVIIGYYFKYIKMKKLWLSFLIVLPIFILVLLSGTRFRVLFSVIPYLVVLDIISIRNNTMKKNVVMIVILLVIVNISSFFKENRNNSLSEISMNGIVEDNDNISINDNFAVAIARKMSPEGVVYMTKLSDDYFKEHHHTYGREISFLFYFWIPRAIWKNKPMPIDHWLIRKYENVPDTFSTASGFTGELKADFGWFSLFILFFIGILLKIGDDFVKKVFFNQPKSPQIIFASMLFSYVFFIVRSPLTATIAFVFQFLIYKLYIVLFYKKYKYK